MKILRKGLAFETPNEKATEASDSVAKPDPECFIVEAMEQPLENANEEVSDSSQAPGAHKGKYGPLRARRGQ